MTFFSSRTFLHSLIYFSMAQLKRIGDTVLMSNDSEMSCRNFLSGIGHGIFDDIFFLLHLDYTVLALLIFKTNTERLSFKLHME